MTENGRKFFYGFVTAWVAGLLIIGLIYTAIVAHDSFITGQGDGNKETTGP